VIARDKSFVVFLIGAPKTKELALVLGSPSCKPGLKENNDEILLFIYHTKLTKRWIYNKLGSVQNNCYSLFFCIQSIVGKCTAAFIFVN
jgi:hypothetical protein